MKDGDDEVFEFFEVFISVSSLWRVPIILRAHFMIFILCLKTWGVLLFVRDVCFFNSYVHINSYFVAFFR